MTGPPETRSPFHLLDELEEASELLILSYTTSLDFFERFALSQARGLGALVTVLSDAAMVSADPVTVRRAGASYLDARAVTPGGAFHPKLFVLVGDRAARVGIGSGNLTMAGWHGNAELLTVLRADDQGGPATVTEVGDFLRRLANSSVALSPGAGETLERVAARLDDVPVTEPGPRLLDNLERPILQALPTTSVEELTCCAPYFDADLKALERLTERCAPSRLKVLLESRTSVDGPRLTELLRRHSGELRWIIDEDRFHHGKLIEWVSEERRWALTGSPNLSQRALVKSVRTGGNCELALLSEVDSSRTPDSETSSAEQRALELSFQASEERSAASILLLAAIRIENSVQLRLHAPLDQAGRIQSYDTDSDSWLTVATLAAGEDNYRIGLERAPVGKALRILLEDGAVSNQIFVTDLARVRRRQMEAVGRARVSPEEIALHGLGSQLLADVEELRPHLLRFGALVPLTSASGDDSTADRGSEDAPEARPAPGADLEDYLAACDPVLGREMTEFALVLPALPAFGNDFDERAAGLEHDLENDQAAEPSEDEDLPSEVDLNEVLDSLSDAERKRWRRWVERLVLRSDSLPMIVRTLALRSVLHGIAEMIWDEEEAEALLAKAAKALAAPGDEPREEELAAAGSLAAIAVVWMRLGIDRLSVRDEYTLRYEEVATAVKPLLRHRSDSQIEVLAPGMPEQGLGAGWVDACSTVVAWILEPPMGAQRAIRLLEEEHDLEAQVEADGSIRLADPIPPKVEPRLCLALGLAGENGPVKVSGSLASGVEAIAVWKAPFLVVEKRSARRWGNLYELPHTHTPSLYTTFDSKPPGLIASWEGDEPRPELAEQLLEEDQG